MNRTTICLPILGLAVALLISACASSAVPGQAAPAETAPIGILVFGDSGYHLGYPDQDDYVDLFDEEQYQQKEWEDWVEDKRPPEEFKARPFAVSPITGKVVSASGLEPVSTAMKNFCGQQTCDFGLMLGDNIYPSGLTFGADGFDDAQRLKHMFADPLGDLVETPDTYLTYATLGNHDWETSRAAGFAQIEYLENADSFYMDGPFYAVKPPGANGEVELFVIDTSMLLASTTVYEDYLDENGAEVVTDEIAEPDYFVEPLSEAEKQMPQWLETSLRNSTAKWKIVVAHHPIWSSSGSKFEQGRALRQLVLPAMCRYADMYLVGHDHTLEIHTDDCSAALGEATPEPLVQVVSGAAAKQRPVNTRFIAQQDEKYPEQDTVWAKGLIWGFAYLELEGDEAHVTLMTVPNDGSPDITTEFEYSFKRRSHSR